MRTITTFVHKPKLTKQEIEKLTSFRGSKITGHHLNEMAELIGSLPPHKDRLKRFTWRPAKSG